MSKTTNSEALSRPETIGNNYNIFKKLINETGNNESTRCLDLALKKLSLNTYINFLGNYNLTSFVNSYSPPTQNRHQQLNKLENIYGMLSPYLSEFKNQNFYEYSLDGSDIMIGDGGMDMYDWGNYTMVQVDNFASNYLSFNQITPINIELNRKTVQVVSLGYTRPLTMLAYCSERANVGMRRAGNVGADGGGNTTSYVVYEGQTINGYIVYAWARVIYNAYDPSVCDLYFIIGDKRTIFYSTAINAYASPNTDDGISFMTMDCSNALVGLILLSKAYGAFITINDCQTVLQNLTNRINYTITVPGYPICTINKSLTSNIFPIGTIPVSQDPKLWAVNYIFTNNILPNQDAYFAYYSDERNYRIFLSDGSSPSIFTNMGEYNPSDTSLCKNANNNLINYPVSVFRLNSLFYKDGNFSKCAATNNSINNINRMNSQYQDSQFNQEINKINEKFTNYEQNKYDTSTTTVQKNLNEIIKNLTDNYNQKAQIYNSTTEAIKNHDFILSSRNQKLNKQTDDLLKIQNDIVLKSREIELNNETTNKQLFIKRVMQGSFILFPLIILILILMYYQAIGPYISLGIISLLVVGYIIYVVVINNKMKIRQFLKPVMGSIREYDNVARQAYNDIVPPVCKSEEAEEQENQMIDNSQFNRSILNSNGPFYYYDGSAPPDQVYPIPIGSIQFDTGNGIIVFPEEIGMSLNSLNNIMIYIFFTSWMMLMMKNGMNLNDPKFLKKLNITDLEDVSSTYNLPVWENIGLPLAADFEDNIKVKCSKYNDIRSKSGKNASIFLVDTWNFFLGDEIPKDIYQKWLKKINSVILRKGNLTKVYFEFYEYVLGSNQFKEKYPPPNGEHNFIQTKFTDFMKFLTQNVKFAENPSFDLSFNLQ